MCCGVPDERVCDVQPEAATIFQSLRELLAQRALSSITYDGVAGDDPAFAFHMDAQAHVQYDQDGQVLRMCTQMTISGGNLTFQIAGQHFNWDLTGAAIEQFLAQSPEDSWAYFQFSELPEDFMERNPSALLLAPIIRLAQVGMYVVGVPLSDGSQRLQMINMDVAALADSRTFSTLIHEIESNAQDVRITRLGRGLYKLVAGDFGGQAGEMMAALLHGAGRQDPLLTRLFRDAVFEVLFSADDGVLEVAIDHVGSADGSIVLVFDEQVQAFHEELFDLEVHRAGNQAPIIDYGLIVRQLEQFQGDGQ